MLLWYQRLYRDEVWISNHFRSCKTGLDSQETPKTWRDFLFVIKSSEECFFSFCLYWQLLVTVWFILMQESMKILFNCLFCQWTIFCKAFSHVSRFTVVSSLDELILIRHFLNYFVYLHLTFLLLVLTCIALEVWLLIKCPIIRSVVQDGNCISQTGLLHFAWNMEAFMEVLTLGEFVISPLNP